MLLMMLLDEHLQTQLLARLPLCCKFVPVVFLGLILLLLYTVVIGHVMVTPQMSIIVTIRYNIFLLHLRSFNESCLLSIFIVFTIAYLIFKYRITDWKYCCIHGLQICLW